ncbi:MAG TPA: VIT1/CCC1 transporter family protein, partial [Terriglobales bacterium]|nr:VIT1/CCC1 transporter family protein [Terriglobales bacterium]
MPQTPAEREVIEALQQNWRAEVQSARMYRELAEHEKDPKRKAVLVRMAEAEERHAARWEKKLQEHGTEPSREDNWRQRMSRWFSRQAGTAAAIRRMEAAEERDSARYSAQRDRALGADSEVKEILGGIALEEKAHRRALQSMVPVLGPRSVLDTILKRERWHGRGGSWVADAIYGVNDGLGAVFGIVSGVAGATDNQRHYVLIAGLAGMIASALSMGAGAYLAVKSEREVYEAEIGREREEVEENP